MKKQEFLYNLRGNLYGLPQIEIDKSVAYYSEIIDDRIEEGASEEAAVAAVGNPVHIASEIKYSQPLTTLIKTKASEGAKKISNSGNTVLWILVLVLGFPLWITLFSVAFSLLIAVYSVIFAVFIAMYAIVFSMIIAGIVGIVSSIIIFLTYGPITGMFSLGVSLSALGTGILCFFPTILASKVVVRATAKFARGIKGLFISKNPLKKEAKNG